LDKSSDISKINKQGCGLARKGDGNKDLLHVQLETVTQNFLLSLRTSLQQDMNPYKGEICTTNS